MEIFGSFTTGLPELNFDYPYHNSCPYPQEDVMALDNSAPFDKDIPPYVPPSYEELSSDTPLDNDQDYEENYYACWEGNSTCPHPLSCFEANP